jgi:hypothetical protein
MQVTVTLSNGTGTQNIDGSAIVQAIPSGSGSLLQVDQYNGSAVELLVDESPATIASASGSLLFSVTLVPVPLVVTATFDYDGATTAFQQGERVFIGNAYGEIIALTSSSMTLGNFVGNQLNDNDFIRGQQSLCTAQIDGAVTYAYPQQQSTYINVGRCQGLKPAVTDLSSLNYIYASPKVEILYTTLTESQLNAASAAAGGGGGSGWGLLGNAGTDSTTDFIGTTDNVGLVFRTNNIPRIGFDATGGTISTSNIFAVSPERGEISWSVTEAALRIYVGGVVVSKIGVNTSGVYLATATDVLFIDNVTSNVGIGTATPAAVVDITSSTSGLLLSRVDTTERDAFTGATNGMIIYNTDVNKFQGYANNAWVDLN